MNDDDDDDVFVLDEELGHEVESTKGPSANKGKAKTENDHNAAEDEDPDNNTASRAGNPLQMSGSMAGSLRASYLRRQDFLDARFRSKVGTTTEVEISDLVKETAPSNSDESELTASMFGTSLPITIRGPSTVRKKAANGSGAQLPPGSSPAGAMLQRRLSRTYGITEENGSLLKVARLGTASNNSVNNSAITGRSVTAATGNLALNPALLVADDFDRVEEEDDDDDENQGGNGARRGFEPPHVFSARTYQPDGIWEKPTRVTVRSGGMEREGSDLDKAIEQARVKLEEEERHNSIATTGAVVPSSAPPGLRTGLNASQNSIKATTATIQEEGEEDA